MEAWLLALPLIYCLFYLLMRAPRLVPPWRECSRNLFDFFDALAWTTGKRVKVDYSDLRLSTGFALDARAVVNPIVKAVIKNNERTPMTNAAGPMSMRKAKPS